MATFNVNTERNLIKRSKLMVNCNMNAIYIGEPFISKFAVEYNKSTKDEKERVDDEAVVYCHPFKVCVIPQVFSYDASFISGLIDELDDLEFSLKNNDLYQFKQSPDLHNTTSPYISHLRYMLETDVRSWLCKVTGRQLSKTIDIFCSMYSYTDYLLCHDDQMEDRCIAFNYYLNSDWSTEDGGHLDMYCTDENGQPSDITRSIIPRSNMLVFFEVSPTTFHQVSEILSTNKTRLTISGWYRSPVKAQINTYVEPQPHLTSCVTVDEQLFYKWINPSYLTPTVQANIRQKFEADSEIELVNFLQPELYRCLLDEIRAIAHWSAVGPPNKRQYERCTPANDGLLQDCIRMLQSDAMFLTLSHLTGLHLHHLYEESGDASTSSDDAQTCDDARAPSERLSNTSDNAKTTFDDIQISSNIRHTESARCTMEVCRWSHGSYTLLHDTDLAQGNDCALDATLYLGCQGWTEDCGGHMSYIAKDDNIELLTVHPTSNNLALVYRDEGTLRFTKRVNHRIEAKLKEFYSLSCVYYE